MNPAYTLWRGDQRLGTFEGLVPVSGKRVREGAWGVLKPEVPAGTLLSMMQATLRAPMPSMTIQHLIEPLTEHSFRQVSSGTEASSTACIDENTPPATDVPESKRLRVTDSNDRDLELEWLMLQEQIFPEGFTGHLPFERNATSRWTVQFFCTVAT